MAADAVVAGLAAGDVSGERLGAWKESYDEGVMHFHKLVYAFYTPGFSFGGLLREHPECMEHLANILMGNVFEPGVGALFEAIGDERPPAENEPSMVPMGEEKGG